jgi:DNA repair protein RecO (recombination protein O)
MDWSGLFRGSAAATARAMTIRTQALLCSTRAHGEHGAVVRLMTERQGLVAGYVAGARGRQLRPLLIPGNALDAEIADRFDGRLPSIRIELVTSRGPWLTEPLASAAIAWSCALTAAALPEGHRYPALYHALAALLDAVCHAPSARGWARALAGYEALLLQEAGYGDTMMPPTDEAWPDLLKRLDRSGRAIGEHLLADRTRDAMATREILLDRLGRIA